MVMLDRKSKRLVEFNSTQDFDLTAVIGAIDSYKEKGFSYSKYFNSDISLLEDNMTPHQFEQIETTHKRMLKEAQTLPEPSPAE